MDEAFQWAWPTAADMPQHDLAPGWKSEPGVECLGLMRDRLKPDTAYAALMQPRSRPLPPKQPQLSASDWVGVAARPSGWPELDRGMCPFWDYVKRTGNLEMLTVKIYKGVVYTNPKHDLGVRDHWRGARCVCGLRA
jgi:hypothetical protein